MENSNEITLFRVSQREALLTVKIYWNDARSHLSTKSFFGLFEKEFADTTPSSQCSYFDTKARLLDDFSLDMSNRGAKPQYHP